MTTMAEPFSPGEPPILPKGPSMINNDIDNIDDNDGGNNNNKSGGCCSCCNFEHVDMAKGYNALGLGKLNIM